MEDLGYLARRFVFGLIVILQGCQNMIPPLAAELV